PHDGNLLVCNTGLDTVATLTREGDLLSQQSVLDSPLAARFSDEPDLRQVLSTKPHQVHPNYVFELPTGELFATCFLEKCAVNLADPNDRFPVGAGNPH